MQVERAYGRFCWRAVRRDHETEDVESGFELGSGEVGLKEGFVVVKFQGIGAVA